MKESITRKMLLTVYITCLILLVSSLHSACALSSSFHGGSIYSPIQHNSKPRIMRSHLIMRKQKASDKHTARMQRGQTLEQPTVSAQILSSGSFTKNAWKHKKIELRAIGVNTNKQSVTGGRGRARKRMKLYNSLEGYHSRFLGLISEEYRMEVS